MMHKPPFWQKVIDEGHNVKVGIVEVIADVVVLVVVVVVVTDVVAVLISQNVPFKNIFNYVILLNRMLFYLIILIFVKFYTLKSSGTSR